jgi:hypothetical protein
MPRAAHSRVAVALRRSGREDRLTGLLAATAVDNQDFGRALLGCGLPEAAPGHTEVAVRTQARTGDGRYVDMEISGWAGQRRTHRTLIESKLKAPFQERQMEDYFAMLAPPAGSLLVVAPEQRRDEIEERLRTLPKGRSSMLLGASRQPRPHARRRGRGQGLARARPSARRTKRASHPCGLPRSPQGPTGGRDHGFLPTPDHRTSPLR